MGSKMLTDEQIAEVAFEATRAYCQLIRDGIEHYPWMDSPEWVKQSFIRGVKFVRNNSDAPFDANHNDWLEQRIVHGWKYGPKKVVALKESPYMVPYDHLPPEQRVKDMLFKGIVNALRD